VDVSNSEVETEQTCQQRHYYGFALGLMKNPLSKPLQIGLYGHSVLEEYYRHLEQGAPSEHAFELTIAYLNRTRPEIATEVWEIVTTRFAEYYSACVDDFLDFEIIHVEEQHRIKLFEGVDFRFTPDLLVRLRNDLGVYLATGAWVEFPEDSYILIDHKWSARFFTVPEVLMNAQLPKYMYGLRQLGYNVTGAMFNQLCYTPNTKIPFARAWISPAEVRIQNIMDEHTKAARRIAANKYLPVAEYGIAAERSFSKFNCSGCAFRVPCSIELNGGDASGILASQFQANPYVTNDR
jgi:hypothetical protein